MQEKVNVYLATMSCLNGSTQLICSRLKGAERESNAVSEVAHAGTVFSEKKRNQTRSKVVKVHMVRYYPSNEMLQ